MAISSHSGLSRKGFTFSSVQWTKTSDTYFSVSERRFRESKTSYKKPLPNPQCSDSLSSAEITHKRQESRQSEQSKTAKIN